MALRTCVPHIHGLEGAQVCWRGDGTGIPHPTAPQLDSPQESKSAPQQVEMQLRLRLPRLHSRLRAAVERRVLDAHSQLPGTGWRAPCRRVLWRRNRLQAARSSGRHCCPPPPPTPQPALRPAHSWRHPTTSPLRGRRFPGFPRSLQRPEIAQPGGTQQGVSQHCAQDLDSGARKHGCPPSGHLIGQVRQGAPQR